MGITMQATARYRELTTEQRAYFNALSGRGSVLYPFSRGDEFFGKIQSSSVRGDTIVVKAQTIVARDTAFQSEIFYAADRHGTALSEGMLANLCRQENDGKLHLELTNTGQDRDLFKRSPLLTTLGMNNLYRRMILANYSDETIRVYQAFNSAISASLMNTGRFGENFEYSRMTWIKPSFLWVMARSKWGTSINQEHVLAIDIKRGFFESLLSNSTLSMPTIGISYADLRDYRSNKRRNPNRVQWDPDKNIGMQDTPQKAIQIGVSSRFVRGLEDAIVNITDITKTGQDIRRAYLGHGNWGKMLPLEFPYPTPYDIIEPLEMHQYFVEENPEQV